jgi:hypothetical protein
MIIPLHTNNTLKIAFEFGVVLASVSNELKIELTPEISEEVERILLRELKLYGTRKTALNFVPLVMSILAPKKTPK